MGNIYKILLLILITSLPTFAFADTSAYENLLRYRSGFGQNVTGGAGGEVIILKDLDFKKFKQAITGDEPKWIRFAAGLSGEIEIDETIFIGSNKTIDGRGANITLTSPNDCDEIRFWGIEKQGKIVSKRSNLIVHNIKVARIGSGPNCGRGISIAFKAQDIWIDHVTFSQNGDESLSMGKGSTNLTASWCKFIDTDKAILLGWSDGDNPEKERALDEKMKVTVHHSFFDQVNGRAPILTYGKAHFYNNFQRNWKWAAATSYEWGQLYSEKNIYVGSTRKNSSPAIDTTHTPKWFRADGYATSKDDVFLSPDVSKHTRGSGINTGQVFSPKKYYSYKPEAPDHHLQQKLLKFSGWSKDPQWPGFKSFNRVFEQRISASSDDAQEAVKTSGLVDFSNQSLHLTFNSNGSQLLGLRFNSLPVKPGSIITKAWIQFSAIEASSAKTELTLHAEKQPNARHFTKTQNNISGRNKTLASVHWKVGPWEKDESGVAQRSPDIASLIQEVIIQKNWKSDSSLVLLISGEGVRNAHSWDSKQSKAPVLHIEYLADSDSDGVVDLKDNCPSVANKDQLDTDHDGKGNNCDTNDDNDRIKDSQDNCPLVINNNQSDTDHDGKGDACDNTPAKKDSKDSDADGIPNAVDNCPLNSNPKQLDVNHNGKGSVCDNDDDSDNIIDSADNCPLAFNLDQLDTDADGQGDVCDKDDDNDNLDDASDNCPLIKNKNQKDKDGDKIGDACDDDDDNDTISNDLDNCRTTPNPEQTNTDGDEQGNACDNDDDNDKVVDSKDNCPVNKNTNQKDTDKDGQGNACDRSPKGGKDPVFLDRNLSSGDDDAEELGGGKGQVVTWGVLLDMARHSSGNQIVGLRYTDITIPRDATIKAAWLQFTAKTISSEPTKLIIKGEKIDKSATFTSSLHNISNRRTTSASVTWSPAAWVKKNDSGDAQKSADISEVIQEIVAQQGWKSGNALSVMISGSGFRGAYTRNSDKQKAAKLHIEYLVQ